MSALLTLLLSIAAVAVAMSHYCRSRYDLIAVLKTLGAGRGALRKLIVGQWLAVMALAAVCGGAIGLAFEALLIRLLKPVLPAAPAAGAAVAVGARRAGADFTAGRAAAVSSIAGHPAAAGAAPRCGGQRLAAALLPAGDGGDRGGAAGDADGGQHAAVGDPAGMAVLALLLGGIGWGSLLLLRRITLKSGAAAGGQPPAASAVVTISQLAAFSLSFMLLALLLVLRGDLLERWQQQLPPDSELFPAQHDRGAGAAGENLPAAAQIKPETYYPIVRVRLTEINQQLATERVHEDDPGGEAVNRELNLTGWPICRIIIRWWRAAGRRKAAKSRWMKALPGG